MTGIEDQLTAALYRVTCPEATELGEYHLALLPDKRRAIIQHHLSECPHCTRELTQLRRYLDNLSPALDYTVAEKINLWIARLIPSGSLSGTPALALRGEGEGPLTYEAGDAQLTIVIQDDPEQPGNKSLLGLVIGIETAGLQAHLWQNATQLATTAVDELGNFALTPLAPGRYELILSGGDLEIHIQDLTV